MKKLFVLIGIVALCAGLLIYSFSGRQPQDADPTTVPTQETLPTGIPEPGQVRFVNPHPEQQALWETLAAEFSSQTGLTVTVLEASTYQSDSDQPTLFTLTDGDDLSQWADKCLDLSCTKGYSQLASWDLTLQSDAKVCGIPMDVECFALVYNAGLLAQAGYSRTDINCFEDLQTVVQSIAANSRDLGFSAFAAADLTGCFAGHLSNLKENLRPFWDLYIQNTTGSASGEGLNDLLSGKAVFYPAGTGDYEALAGLGDHQLGVLPLYTGGENEENGILHVEVQRYLCIRADAPEQDVQAALDFLSYLVHPRADGSVPIDDLGLLAPYRQATFAANRLETFFREELASGRACRNCISPTAPEGFAQALTAYGADPTDENWAKVMELL